MDRVSFFIGDCRFFFPKFWWRRCLCFLSSWYPMSFLERRRKFFEAGLSNPFQVSVFSCCTRCPIPWECLGKYDPMASLQKGSHRDYLRDNISSGRIRWFACYGGSVFPCCTRRRIFSREVDMFIVPNIDGYVLLWVIVPFFLVYGWILGTYIPLFSWDVFLYVLVSFHMVLS